MDPKSTAKSKRIHSQQGRKNHPSPSAAASKRQSSAAASGGPHRREKLPSNWVRYEDDPDEFVGNKGQQPMISAQTKGADYGFLIDEARTQQRLVSSSQPEEFSFDFLHGSCSILSSKGEALFNRCADDNFVVDDDSSNYEVFSLTMDLKALAGQLSKLTMSQRLFLEDFSLPDYTKYHNKSEYKPESRHGHLDITTLSSAEPETGFSDQVTIEMVSSLTCTSKEQDNNNNNINSQTGSGISNSAINKMTVLDESVDDLLEQNMMDVKRGNETEPAKQVDDFDSWFDSL